MIGRYPSLKETELNISVDSQVGIQKIKSQKKVQVKGYWYKQLRSELNVRFDDTGVEEKWSKSEKGAHQRSME